MVPARGSGPCFRVEHAEVLSAAFGRRASGCRHHEHGVPPGRNAQTGPQVTRQFGRELKRAARGPGIRVTRSVPGSLRGGSRRPASRHRAARRRGRSVRGAGQPGRSGRGQEDAPGQWRPAWPSSRHRAPGQIGPGPAVAGRIAPPSRSRPRDCGVRRQRRRLGPLRAGDGADAAPAVNHLGVEPAVPDLLDRAAGRPAALRIIAVRVAPELGTDNPGVPQGQSGCLEGKLEFLEQARPGMPPSGLFVSVSVKKASSEPSAASSACR